MSSGAGELASLYICTCQADPAPLTNGIFRLVWQQVLGRLVDKVHGDASSELAGLVAKLQVAAPIGWRPELGLAKAHCDTNHFGSALQLLVAVQDAEFEVRLPVGFRLYLDGWFADTPSGMIVSVSGNEMRLSAGDCLRVFERRSGRWQPSPVDAYDNQWVLPSASAFVRHIGVYSRPGASGLFPAFAELRTTPERASGHQATIEADVEQAKRATAALGELSEGVRQWIGTTCHSLALLTSEAPVAMSSPNYPGMVAMRAGCSWFVYLETIAAALSHQKLHQVSLIERLTLGASEEIHYLRSSREYTTTRRVLAAAYEHAHVVVVLRELIDTCDGADMAAVERRLLHRTTRLEAECESALEAAVSLSAMGRSLWEDIQSTCLERIA